MVYNFMYLTPTYSSTYFLNHLSIYYPLTHLPIIYLPTYTFSLTYLHTYLYFSLLSDLPTYLPTYLYIVYYPIHPLTYLILPTKCNHYVEPLDLVIRFTQILIKL